MRSIVQSGLLRVGSIAGAGIVAGLGAALGLATPAMAQDVPSGATIVREATGERRAALDAMEREMLDERVWSTLSDWSGSVAGVEEGTPLSPANTRGKVVLFYTWASYYGTSARPISMLRSLQEELGEQGLIVVAVHNPQGFEDASSTLERRRANFISAHDRDGRFREMLRADQEPDFYLVDRAGQLRYADIATTSVRDAARKLVAESGDDASTLNERLAAADAERERLFRRLERIRQSIDIEQLPRVPFSTPTDEQYGELRWPRWGVEQRNRRRSDEDQAPVDLALPDEGWTPSKPEPHGQGMVMFFWHPALRTTFDLEMREMDELQRAHARDLVVIGAIPQLQVNDRNRDEAQRREVERLLDRGDEALAEMKRGRQWAHLWVEEYDTASISQAMNARNDDGTAVLGGIVAVATSDGKIRWIGSMRSSGFRIALNELLTDDPGIRARREAELAFIASNPEQLGVDEQELEDIESALELLDDEGD